MTGKTHLAGGAAVAALFCADVPSALLVLIGSLLPDIDHGSSMVGKSVPLVHRFLTHRGFTHGILFIVLMSWLVSPWLAVGVTVHILFDMMTSQGVHLFSPITASIAFYPFAHFVKTGGLLETLVRYVCYVITVILLLNLLVGDPLGTDGIRNELRGVIGG